MLLLLLQQQLVLFLLVLPQLLSLLLSLLLATVSVLGATAKWPATAIASAVLALVRHSATESASLWLLLCDCVTLWLYDSVAV